MTPQISEESELGGFTVIIDKKIELDLSDDVSINFMY